MVVKIKKGAGSIKGHALVVLFQSWLMRGYGCIRFAIAEGMFWLPYRGRGNPGLAYKTTNFVVAILLFRC